MTLEVLSKGVVGNYNGALQVMTAELQLPTPIQHANGTWDVVDVSLDNLPLSPSSRCRRRPSGCLIQEMPNGYSKVRDTLITNQEGRKSMMKLAERMVISFCAGVSASTAHTWTTLSGTSADDDPGRPPGIVLSAATSFWLHVPPKRVFDFLRDENSRNEVCAKFPKS
ncbi:hypothetical protein GYH30_043131 [Glycine max]|nr:hypothetical protein GYH30_043131 [Glycine max]